jgi:hypothetical protein
MPRVALLDSLQLCKISGYLYTPYVQDQRYFTSFIVDRFNHNRRSSSDAPFQDLAGHPRILGIDNLRPLRGQHAYKASLRSAPPDSLQLC